MAIEKISANDDNAPKFDIFREYKKINKQNLYIILPFCLLAFFFAGGLGGAVILFIFGYSILTGIRMIILRYKTLIYKGKKEYDRVHNYYKDLAIRNNITVTYESPGIIVDNQSKKIVFTIDPEQKSRIIICDFSDIRKWYSHTSTMINERYKVSGSGQITASRTETNFTGVRVEINDPDQPLYGFWTANKDDSDRWLARLSSLING